MQAPLFHRHLVYDLVMERQPAGVTMAGELRKASAITFFADNYVSVLWFALTTALLSTSA